MPNSSRATCAEFNAFIELCTPSSSDRQSIKRDWLNLQYIGEDIIIENIRTRLQPFVIQGETATEIDTGGLRRAEEKDIVQKSLGICERFLTIIISCGLACLETQGVNTWKGFDKGQTVHSSKYHLLDPAPSDIQNIKEINRSDASSALEVELNGEKCAMKLVSK